MAPTVREQEQHLGPGGLLLLAVVIVASITGCASDTQATSNSTATTAAAGQTGAPSGTPSGFPSGIGGPTTPPTDGASTTTSAATSPSNDSTTTTEARATTTTAAEGTYSDGIYLVGTDIHSGLYHGRVNGDKGHWEISSDANGQTLVANEYPLGPFTLKVKSGQYLTLRGVTVSQ